MRQRSGKRRLSRNTWIVGSHQTLAVGRVVQYVTHQSYESGRWDFPAGMNCLATRSPRGELVLLFLLPFDPQRDVKNREIAAAVWLDEGVGLCGVEPGVLDPMKSNHLMVQKACDEATARVGREIAAETARAREMQGEVEHDLSVAASQSVAEDLDRAAVEEIAAVRGADGSSWNTMEAATEKKVDAGSLDRRAALTSEEILQASSCIPKSPRPAAVPRSPTVTTGKKRRVKRSSVSSKKSESPTSTRRRST